MDSSSLNPLGMFHNKENQIMSEAFDMLPFMLNMESDRIKNGIHVIEDY